MKIKDPKDFAWELNSPYEIYAAGRWKGLREDPQWQRRAAGWAEINSPVYRGLLPPAGSSILSLAKDLFFLHLTVRKGSPGIFRALSFLKRAEASVPKNCDDANDLPFETDDDPDIAVHSWLFSAAVFGRSKTREWKETAAAAGKRVLTEGPGLSSRSLYNFLRGCLIIPESENIAGAAEAVKLLSSRQEDSGFFKALAPWQVYNLMAHSTLPAALQILEKLEPPLLRMQNSDASWGSGGQKPLATFLMAHGLQNRGFFNYN